MVDVTRYNFDELLPEVKAHIEASSFVALDTEFTGLHVEGSTGNSLFDSPDLRYEKLKQLTSQFTVCQIGLCAFVKEPKKNSYVGHAYNFYLFPRSCADIDARFLCQASSLEFLVQHNFDFNRLFYDGISYMNTTQEKSLKEQPVIEMARGVDEDMLKHCHTVIAEWLPSTIEGDKLPLDVTLSDKFVSLQLQTMLRDYFPVIWTNTSATGQVIVKRVSEESRKELEKATENRLLEYILGFTHVFRILVESKKPLLGHNMVTDLLFVHEKFHNPLPDKFSDFKKAIHTLFPQVVDTKHLSFKLKKELIEKGLPVTSTGLDQLYQNLCSDKGRFLVLHSPYIELSQIQCKYKDSHPLHEAAYDAYLCGYVFLRLAHFQAAKKISATVSSPLGFRAILDAVKPWMNKLNLIRANVPYINLAGPDPPSRRPRLLHVSAIGMSTVSASKLAEEFSIYSSVDVQLVDKRNALLAVSTYGGCKDIMRAFKDHKTLRVKHYNVFQHSRPVRYTLWGAIAVLGAACLWTLFGDQGKVR
ncbi:poly(A)-specific ribonuclease PNLDC1-like [Amphiura filiformis]|uniref:poly(A)-specific ribonuclease PNLDC1-like n=1 Tax=Amphiura filiformis TaxID=82378 RepID=UPI003B216A84